MYVYTMMDFYVVCLNGPTFRDIFYRSIADFRVNSHQQNKFSLLQRMCFKCARWARAVRRTASRCVWRNAWRLDPVWWTWTRGRRRADGIGTAGRPKRHPPERFASPPVQPYRLTRMKTVSSGDASFSDKGLATLLNRHSPIHLENIEGRWKRISCVYIRSFTRDAESFFRKKTVVHALEKRALLRQLSSSIVCYSQIISWQLHISLWVLDFTS